MRYFPRSLPPNSTVDDLREHVERELAQIALVFGEQEFVAFRILHAPPPRPREGMLVYADGVDWDPSVSGPSGSGLYEYDGTEWHKISSG